MSELAAGGLFERCAVAGQKASGADAVLAELQQELDDARDIPVD